MQTTNEPSATPSDKDFLKIAFDYAWNWTNAYYDTRLRAVQFYVTGNAFLVAGYVASLASRPGIAAAIALVGTASSLAFFAIDRATKRYVGIGEKALAELEDRVADELNIDSLRLIWHLRGDPVGKPSRATRVVWSIYLGATMVWLAVAIYTLTSTHSAACRVTTCRPGVRHLTGCPPAPHTAQATLCP